MYDIKMAIITKPWSQIRPPLPSRSSHHLMKTNDYDFRGKVLDQLESRSMPPKVFPSFICPLCEAKVFTASFNLLSINHYVKPSCTAQVAKTTGGSMLCEHLQVPIT